MKWALSFLKPINLVNLSDSMYTILFAILLTSLGPFAPYSVDSKSQSEFFDPVKKEIQGWTVFIEPVMVGEKQTDQDRRALQMLENHLQRIQVLVHPNALMKLRQVPIWIERDHPRSKTMCYHPSESWLRANQHDPRLAKCVHITQASQLISPQQMLKHPAVVLHELAHAYHDQFLGFRNAEVEAVFENAKLSGSYDRVMDHLGNQVRHYGMNNAKEYFAESTEAYFYRNDFYPFVRGELKKHDPQMFELLERLWSPQN